MEYLEILQRLIQCRSVTPVDDGAIGIIQSILKELGFVCHILEFEEPGHLSVINLYAKLEAAGPNLCFAGHTDVVTAGDWKHWKFDPFAGIVDNGAIYGRGAVDMKGAIAAFLAALLRLRAEDRLWNKHLSFLITGDEEGFAINGTKKVLQWLREKGEAIDFCIVGEPSSFKEIGDTIKVGARGSATFNVEVFGKQGHVAFHRNALNPIPILANAISELNKVEIDQGNEHFQPSNLEFTELFVQNPVENVIPEMAKVQFNIRFNNLHSAQSIATLVQKLCEQHIERFSLKWHSSGEAFLAQHSKISEVLSDSIQEILGIIPEFSTAGGTSDARFMVDMFPAVEFGLINKTAHQIDEHVRLEDVEKLTCVYKTAIEKFFA